MPKQSGFPTLSDPQDGDTLAALDISEAVLSQKNKQFSLLALFNWILSKWVYPSGWATYVDDQYTEGSPLVLAVSMDTLLSNNAASYNHSQKPADVNTFYFAKSLDISSATGSFSVEETITGGTSGATAIVIDQIGDTLLLLNVSGTFAAIETITGGTSGATATVDAINVGGVTGRNGDGLDFMIYFKAKPTNNDQYLDIWIDIGGGVGELYRQTFSFPKGTGVERGILYALPSAYTLATWEANNAKVYVRSGHLLDIYDINYNFDRSHKAR